MPADPVLPEQRQEEMTLRITALDIAMRLSHPGGRKAEEVLKEARLIEAYIRGEEPK